MAGIYLHIPFCRRKCHYCNFFSLASQKQKAPLLTALKQEIAATRDYLHGEPVNTIYFGGGTPSVYAPEELGEILEMVAPVHKAASPPDPSHGGEARLVVPDSSEFTLEINPEDVTEAFVEELKHTRFNRFSLGVQSFDDEDLAFLNRSHSAEKAILAVKMLQEAGYRNISIDLIYGIPSADNNRWRKNLEIAFSLDVPHISAYALTVEPKTPLAWMIGHRKSAPVSDESQVEQFKILMKESRDNGFQQYEISNFCKPGMHAIHNTNYWNGIPYLGLGPSAHSYNGTSRRWNISNLSAYIDRLNGGVCLYEEETLTNIQQYNEYVMTSLRTMWGCNLEKINEQFAMSNEQLILKRAQKFVTEGLLTEKSGVFFLTDEGKLFADAVASELFITK
ncbi:MAG: radical SAM family heme chaperone HemW [Bacteroidales bacterium]